MKDSTVLAEQNISEDVIHKFIHLSYLWSGGDIKYKTPKDGMAC